MALRELHTALFRQFNPSYEDYSAVVEVDWPKVAEEPAAAIIAAASSDTAEEDDQAPETRDDGTEPVSEKKPAVQPRRPLEHIDVFFSKYPQFKRDSTKSVATQLNELRKQEKWWGHRRRLWDVALWEYQTALVQQFNASYGMGSEVLEAWHQVLRRIRAGELPQTVEGCKRVSEICFTSR